MATIKDISQETGFSITTVSRVLNQDKNFNVSDETRLKIMTAAEKANYIPLNQRQKGRVSKKKTKIALIYWYSPQEELTDPYYLSIRLAIESYYEAREIVLQRFHLADKSLDELKSLNLAGVIALGKYSSAEVENMRAISPHVVLVDCYSKHYEVDVVMANLQEATEDILAHCHHRSIQSVGFIGGEEKTLDGLPLADVRLETYRSSAYGQTGSIAIGEFSADSGYLLMKDLIGASSLMEAYLVASDGMAIGCLKALSEAGLRVPEDVSIISYDNLSLSRYTIPALTTLDMNTTLMGETAAALLEERIASNRSISKKVFIPTRLIIRGSSK